MGTLGYGYGSECHLLRWLGRHQNKFNHHVARVIDVPPSRIEWVDFHFDSKQVWPDAERTGLDFLHAHPRWREIEKEWRSFWPQSGRAQNWDAVGYAARDGTQELLLVEAKAEASSELRSKCEATSLDSRRTIERALQETKTFLQVDHSLDWTKPYYQFANRLAVLYFLNQKVQVPARLLMIYFVGDTCCGSRVSPQSISEWADPIDKQNASLGLPKIHALSERVHKLFLHIAGEDL